MKSRAARAVLNSIGIEPTRFSFGDLLREAALTISRAPVRTILTSTGTILAVGTAIATIGLSGSAAGAVSATFNQLRATTVTFTETNPGAQPGVLTEAGERALDRLNGVTSAGLMWPIGGDGSVYPVTRSSQPDPTGQSTVSLPAYAASPAALRTIGAVISTGREYDPGMDHRRDPVALLGEAAATELGITDVDLSPVIYVNRVPVTVIGIVGSATQENQLLLGVIVPPGIASSLTGTQPVGSPQIIARTVAGAAQLIGAQGPEALDPDDPGAVTAEVPIDPTLLHNQVSQSLTSLLLAIAAIALGVGLIAIANTTLLSVLQRSAEIGLRRATGAAPRHIALLFITEAALVGGVGAIIGTSLGVLVTAAVCAANGWVPVLAPALIAAAPPAGAVAGLLAGLYPARRASLVTPISALQQ